MPAANSRTLSRKMRSSSARTVSGWTCSSGFLGHERILLRASGAGNGQCYHWPERPLSLDGGSATRPASGVRRLKRLCVSPLRSRSLLLTVLRRLGAASRVKPSSRRSRRSRNRLPDTAAAAAAAGSSRQRSQQQPPIRTGINFVRVDVDRHRQAGQAGPRPEAGRLLGRRGRQAAEDRLVLAWSRSTPTTQIERGAADGRSAAFGRGARSGAARRAAVRAFCSTTTTCGAATTWRCASRSSTSSRTSSRRRTWSRSCIR